MRNWKTIIRAHIEPLPIDPARAADIVDELAQHVAEHHAELLASGVDDDDALALALQPLRDRRRVAEEIACADRPRASAPPPPPAGRTHLLGDLIRDVRYAARLLARAPGFATAALVTLALGIGANTAIFSVLNAVLLRPLPYADPDRLLMAGERGPDGSAGNVGYMTFLDWRDRSHGFEDMALIRSWSATLVSNGEPERVSGMRVSSNYFRVLGVRPALGRDFLADDDTPSRWRVLLLSDGLWRRRFNADPQAVGRVVTMNGQPFTIVGILPASFQALVSEHFYKRAEMWSLVGYDQSLSYACRSCQHLKAIVRIKRGVSMDTARADLDAVHAQLRAKHPSDYPRSTITLVPLQDELTGNVRPALAVLMGAVAFVLLIACANVANLFLARFAQRSRDLALRTALGASRARLVRQLLTESALVAVGGGGLGLLLSTSAVPLLGRLMPSTMPRLAQARVDGHVLAFALAISLATALVFGLLPSLRAARTDLHGTLQGEGRRTAQGPTSAARRLLVATDVALAVVLLAGAGLMTKSVGRLLAVDPGFDPNHVLTMQLAFVGPSYGDNASIVATSDQILARLRALPGVQGAAAAGQIPLSGNGDRWSLHIQGRASNPAEDPAAERYSVTPEYFSAMRIPLVQGRLILDADRANSEQVMLIGEQTARTLWPHNEAIGQHVRIGDPNNGPWRTIVGIVGDVRHHDLAAPPTLQMYAPQAQLTDSYITIVIRAKGDPSLLAGEARGAISGVARDVAVSEIAPLTELVSRSVGPRRFVMALLELFACVALVMTAVGVYGVLSYSVAERTREIGVRAALGASRLDILRLVLGGGLGVVSAGLAAGVIVAMPTTRYLHASLYGVSATDPATFARVVLVLFAVAAVAQTVPVLRALHIDPAAALRQE